MDTHRQIEMGPELGPDVGTKDPVESYIEGYLASIPYEQLGAHEVTQDLMARYEAGELTDSQVEEIASIIGL